MKQRDDSRDKPQKPDEHPSFIGKAPPATVPVNPGQPEIPRPVVPENIGTEPPYNSRADSETESRNPVPVRVVNDSLLTREVGESELGMFERRTLRYASWGVFVGVLTLLVILGTAIVFWDQFQEMTAQTDILDISARQARRDSAESSLATQKQLAIAQQQAKTLAKQLMYNQQLVESQRGSISVSFGKVINPITFHDGSASIVFSILLQNTGAVKATHVAVRFKPYYSLMDNNIFTEPLQRQRDYCAADIPPSQEWGWDKNGKRIDLKGLRDWTVTIEPNTALEQELNFGMGKPTEAEIIKWPPPDVIQNNPTLPVTDRIFPVVVGCVDYQSGAMPERHQTGFIFEVQEVYSDAMTSNAAPTLVHYGIDLPRERVVITQFFFGQGKKY